MHQHNQQDQEKTPVKTEVLQRALTESLNFDPQGTGHDYVYCVGNINAKFPTLNLEKELNQNSIMSSNRLSMLENVNDDIALARLNRNTQLYQQLFKGLSQPQNNYIARDMNWVLDNRFNEQQYQLIVHNDELLKQCISALGRNEASTGGQVVVIGTTSGVDELHVSAIMPTTVMPFGQLLQGEQSSNSHFIKLVDELTGLDCSAGSSDASRAINFLLYNNLDIYNRSYSLYYSSSSDGPNPSGYQLLSVDTDTMNSGDRIVTDVVFKYQGINTGALQHWYCRVDVTGEYPFLVSSWQPYLHHSRR